MMQGIRVRKAILGAGGIMAEGIYNSNLLLVETERQMMKCGQEVVIVADHTKFGRLALAQLCGLDAIDHVVVDPGLPDEYRAILEAEGVDDPPRPPRGRVEEWGGRRRAADRRPEDRSMSTARFPRPGRAAGPVDPPPAARGWRRAGPKPANGEAVSPARGRQHLGRHCHLTQEDVDVLFGAGYQLTPMKTLYQDRLRRQGDGGGGRPAAADDPGPAHPRPVPRVQPGGAGLHRRDQPGPRRAGPALGRRSRGPPAAC